MQMCVGACVLHMRGAWAALGPRPLGELNMLCQGHIHSQPAFQNLWKEGIFSFLFENV